jgi:hypothetical protein
MTDSVRDDLAAVRAELERMLGPSDYAIPPERFQPTEHERMILRRVIELADVVDRLAAKVDGP